ncbi:glycine oxidase ThiO [Caldalkalibacillus thermarum]|nr:glycine oxidase ThiO [Caldalkalibacillus thermarum]
MMGILTTTRQRESLSFPARPAVPHSPLTIVGGGIIGLSIAFECAKRGLKVIVLEKTACGGQATGAAAGMLAPYSEIGEDPDDFFTLCHHSLKLYPDWQQEVRTVSGLAFEYTRSGSLYLAFHEADELALKSRLEWQKEWGVQAEIVRGQALRNLEPHLTQEAVAALYYPDEHHVYTPDFVQALLAACEKMGVHIVQHAGEVRFKEVTADGLLLETGEKGCFSTDQCVLASGAWTSFFEEPLQLRLPIFPIRGQICAYEQGQEEIKHIIFSSQGYVLSKGNGTIVCGASEDIAGFDTSTTEKGISRLVKWSRYLFPFLKDKEPFHCWAGLRPATQDGYPLLGRLRHQPNVILASGHYRNGILLSPVTAKVVADIIEGRQPAVNLKMFDPLRFQ